MPTFDGQRPLGPPQPHTVTRSTNGEHANFPNGHFTGAHTQPVVPSSMPLQHHENTRHPHMIASAPAAQGSAKRNSQRNSQRNAGASAPSAHHNTTPVSRDSSSEKGNVPPRPNQRQLLQQQQLQMMQQPENEDKSANAQSPQNGSNGNNQMRWQNNGRPVQGTESRRQSVVSGVSQNGHNGPNGPNSGPLSGPNSGHNSTPNSAPTSAQQESLNARIFRRNTGNAAIMRILDLVESVSSAPYEMISSVGFWARVCEAFFRPSAVIRFTVAGESPSQNGNVPFFRDARSASNTYQLNISTAPKFLLAQVLSHNVQKHDLFLTGFRYQLLAGGFLSLMCRINITFHYEDGSMGTSSGTCRFLMARDFYVQHVDCRLFSFHKSISMDSLQRQWTSYKTQENTHNGYGDFYQQVAQTTECLKHSRNAGLSESATRLMQIGDVMTCLHPLMSFLRSNQISSPLKALESFVVSARPLRRTSMASHQNEGTSPSPKAVGSEEPKAFKKRRVSSSLNSPMTEPRR